MSKEEYANYDYQTTTVPLKTEYGVTIGTETKSTYKLCTNDCIYKNNWNELKNYLEKQIIDSKAGNSQQYYFNTIYKYMQELENRKV